MNTSNKPVGWAIVGTGMLADTFVAPALKTMKSVKLVAVHSRDRLRGIAFATKYQIERSYDSYSEMLADPEVEAVHIITPNNLHAPQTIEAAKAGKHVLCEKPMANSIEECERMIEACKENRVKLGVGFQMRFHPAHLEACKIISSGKIGDVTLATLQYSHGLTGTWAGWRADPAMSGGGGALLGMGIHLIDLLRYLFGQEVEEVTALSDAKWLKKPIDDTILIDLKFANGPFASIISGIHVPNSCNDIVIYGTKARIRGIDTLGMPMKGKLELVGNNVEKIEHTFPESPLANYVSQAEAFNKCIREDIEPFVTGADGLEMVRLAMAILESTKLGKAIKVNTKS